MNIKVICKDCNKEVKINDYDVTHEKEFEDENGQTILLSYFDCPSCQERQYVQVDNGQTLVIKRDNIKMFRRLSRLRDKGKQIPKQQSEKFGKLREELTNKRNELMKQYDGSLVTDTETGEQVKLSFTVL